MKSLVISLGVTMSLPPMVAVTVFRYVSSISSDIPES